MIRADGEGAVALTTGDAGLSSTNRFSERDEDAGDTRCDVTGLRQKWLRVDRLGTST
jgi:hypothetical protein